MRYGMSLAVVFIMLGWSAALAQPGYIQINSAPGISIYLNGQYKGLTSTSLGGYLISNVPPGNHRVRAEKEGAPAYEVELTVRAGEVTTHEIVDIMKGATVEAPGAAPNTIRRNVSPTDLRSGTLIVQSKPMEVQITIPNLGIRGARKGTDVWQQSPVPLGNYTAAFRGSDTTLVKRFAIGAGRTTHLMVDFETNTVTVTDRISRGVQVVEAVPSEPREATPENEVAPRTQPTVAQARPAVVAPPRAFRREHAGPHGMIFVEIPPGQFQQGSVDGDVDEKPMRTVRITKGFQIGKYEVTQQVWEAVMGSNPSLMQSLERPVEQVSWTGTQRFLRALNEQDEEWTYRLPTEAEWEYAARAGSQAAYVFSSDPERLADYAWYSGDAGVQPVGRKQPNAWGLYDMLGNVWEWVADWYDADAYAGGPATDPQGPEHGTARVQRGGSWSQGATNLRVSNRAKGAVIVRSPDIGFRIVRERR